jgi:RES domain-containing protein
MNTFRIAQNQYAHDLSGKGAELFGGRWNSIGIPLLYSSQHRSLCILEHLAHLPEGAFLNGYSLITIEFPDSSTVQEINLAHLSNDWKNNPISPDTRKLGNKFAEDCQCLALKVPSVLVPAEFNILLNPRHPDFKLVKLVLIEPFVYDERLVR